MTGIFIKDAEPADPKLIGQGNDILHEQRSIILRRTIRGRSEIKDSLKVLHNKVNSILTDAKIEKNTIDPAAKLKINNTLEKNIPQAFQKIENHVEDHVRIAMSNTLVAQNKVLVEAGLRPLNLNQRKKIVQNHLEKWQTEEFPPKSNITVQDRFRKQRQKITQKVDHAANLRIRKNDIKPIDRNIERGLLFHGPGRTPVKGGSSFRQINRLSFAEQSRKSNDVAIDAMRFVGIELATWRIHPMHPWYGGQEICEVLANKVNNSTKLALQKQGVDISKLDLHGVYLLSQWPNYPHPFCKCSPDPYFTPDQQKQLLESRIAIQKLGEFPENLLFGSSANAVESRAVAGSFNAVANELNLGTIVTQNMVETFGVDGLGNLFATKIHAIGKSKQVLSNIKRILVKDVASSQAQLDALRLRISNELKQLAKDKLISQASKASIRSRYMSQLQRELAQFDANVRSLMSIEKYITNPVSTIRSTAQLNKNALLQRVIRLGLRADEVIFQTKGGKWWMTLKPKAANRIIPEAQKLAKTKAERLAKIKGLKIPEKKVKGMVKKIGDRKFELRRDQIAGIEFIEEEKRVLLHFAPGLGKTPTAIGSISDLAAKGEITKGLIITPVPVRDQFAKEIIKFNAKGRVSLYIPKAEIKKMQKVLREGFFDEVFEPLVKKVDKQGISVLNPSERQQYTLWKRHKDIVESKELIRKANKVEKGTAIWDPGEEEKFKKLLLDKKGKPQPFQFDNEADELAFEKLRKKTMQDYVDPKMNRIDLKAMVKDPKKMNEILAKDKNLFTVMSHDDMAKHPTVLKNHFEHITIDEIHQLTSPSIRSGSTKAKALQKLSGGKIKYKVAMTGTATRNSLGELWDIIEWIRPGRLPGKKEFMFKYDTLTLESNMFQKAILKTLRREIDEFTFTMPSPVKAKLINPFNPAVSEIERAETFRKVTMTKAQLERTGVIEKEYQKLRNKYTKLKKQVEEDFKKELNWDQLTKAQRTVATKKLNAKMTKWRNDQQKLMNKKREEFDALRKQYKIEDPDSEQAFNKIASLSREKQRLYKKARKEFESLNKSLNPQSWRDNQHFLNIHNISETHASKIQETVSLITNKLPDKKIIIHAERAKSIDLLKSAIQRKTIEGRPYKVLTYTGDMSSSERAAALKAFNSGEADVLILSRAGSTGLNVQKVSHTTIHFDTPYTYTEYLQREARNWRTGQKHDVKSYLMHNIDSPLDRRRLQIFEQKKQILEAVDELTKITEHGNPLATIRRLKRMGVESVDDLMTGKAKKNIGKVLDSLCKELNALGIQSSACAPKLVK